MRLLLGYGWIFYLSFPEKQVYWRVAENGRVGAMKQKKEREKEISQWPWISMLPFGILAGYWGDKGSADHGNFRIWLSDPPCGTGYGGAEKRTVGTGILRSENGILPADSSS